MVTRVKRRIALALLAALSIWPLVHYGLARCYHIDHWRFSGFAMYTRPTDQPTLKFLGQLGDRPLTPDALRAALGPDARRVDAYVTRRKLWGELAEPSALGRLILDRMPQLSELTIVIDTATLAPGDDRLSTYTDRYLCARPATPGERVCAKE